MIVRILHIVTHLNRGGLETMIMNYYRNLDRKEIQFDFLVQGEEIGAYENEITEMGGKIYRVKRIKHYAPWLFEKEVYNFFKGHKEYQIVHSHINAFSKYVLRAAKKAKVPNRIAHSHIVLKNNNLKNIYKNLLKIGINKYATKRFACSEEAGKWLYGKAEYEILPNAINVEKFKFNEAKRKEYREKMGFKNEEIIYFNIGRFVEQKNQMFLIDIFYEIQKNQKAKLVLIGDGKLKNRLESKVKELKIKDKVIFTGVRNDVSDLINAMDIFVFPSLYEGLGIVLVESQANGLKCYVSDAIPKEAIILNNVKVISLKNNCSQWAKKILANDDVKRNSEIGQIKENGYDIKENSRYIQRFYLELL